MYPKTAHQKMNDQRKYRSQKTAHHSGKIWLERKAVRMISELPQLACRWVCLTEGSNGNPPVSQPLELISSAYNKDKWAWEEGPLRGLKILGNVWLADVKRDSLVILCINELHKFRPGLQESRHEGTVLQARTGRPKMDRTLESLRHIIAQVLPHRDPALVFKDCKYCRGKSFFRLF